MLKKILKKETNSLAHAYNEIDYNSQALQLFLNEIFCILKSTIPLTSNLSLLDFGSGRGYFLKYLEQRGYKNIQGVEPSTDFKNSRLFDNIVQGSYEDNTFANNSFDIVFTCHTLHHLTDKQPLYAIRELLRITRKHIVIVEINNSNIPMFFRSLFYLHQEENAFSYNLSRVQSMLASLECMVVYSNYLESSYLSGNSFIYRALTKVGRPPYNLSIAVKQ